MRHGEIGKKKPSMMSQFNVGRYMKNTLRAYEQPLWIFYVSKAKRPQYQSSMGANSNLGVKTLTNEDIQKTENRKQGFVEINQTIRLVLCLSEINIATYLL